MTITSINFWAFADAHVIVAMLIIAATLCTILISVSEVCETVRGKK